MSRPVVLVTGQPFAFPRECYLRGSGGTVPAVYNATDVLTAAVVQSRQTAILFAPTVVWYTADNTQVGYLQGEVEVIGSTAQASLLVATISYTCLIWRALVGDPGDPELIARVPLVIEPIPA